MLGSGRLPAVPGLTKATPALTVRETITLGSTLSGGKNVLSYLPVPYAPRSVAVSGDWRVERNSLSIYTTTTALAGLRYTVASADVEPSPQQLRNAPAPPASERGYLTVPQPFQRLRPLASARHRRAEHRLRQGGRAAAVVHRARGTSNTR